MRKAGRKAADSAVKTGYKSAVSMAALKVAWREQHSVVMMAVEMVVEKERRLVVGMAVQKVALTEMH